MTGFFDLPFELRDQIFSLAMTPRPFLCEHCPHLHEPDRLVRIEFGAPYKKLPPEKADAWSLLGKVSLVSKQFASEARPQFIRNHDFVVWDSVDTDGPRKCLVVLQWFLSWLRVENEANLRKVHVCSGMNGRTISADIVLAELAEMNAEKRRKLGPLQLEVNGMVTEVRAISAYGVFNLDEGGQWRLVKWTPFEQC